MMREMALKKRLVDGDVLVGVNGLADLDFEHAIHQQKGIAVREMLENLMNIHLISLLN